MIFDKLSIFDNSSFFLLPSSFAASDYFSLYFFNTTSYAHSIFCLSLYSLLLICHSTVKSPYSWMISRRNCQTPFLLDMSTVYNGRKQTDRILPNGTLTLLNNFVLCNKISNYNLSAIYCVIFQYYPYTFNNTIQNGTLNNNINRVGSALELSWLRHTSYTILQPKGVFCLERLPQQLSCRTPWKEAGGESTESGIESVGG